MSLLLAISLGLNLLVLVGGLVAVRRKPEVAMQFMRTGQDQMKSFFEEFRVRPGDIVFLGDSLTAGARWPEVFPGRPVRNRGIRGDTSTGVLGRLGPIVKGRPSQILLMVGTNDLGFDRDVEEIVVTYEAILDRIRDVSPSTEVIVQSILPRQQEYVDRVSALNDALKQLSSNRGLRFCNLHPSFANEQGELRSEFTNDGLHLLGPGYALWAELIRDVVAPGPPPPAETLRVLESQAPRPRSAT